MKRENGITLVALVVTIIILLIFAGVSISLVFDSEGLFSKANDTAYRYNVSKNEEVNFLTNSMTEMNTYDVPELDNTKKTEPDGDWWIPKGFEETEDSGETIEDGKVIQDKAGNQFVWIPCYVIGGNGQDVSSATEYKRTDFGKQYGTYTNYNETLDTENYNSIKKYGGFYIGRYEADANTTATSEDITRNVLIQKNKNPYNFISITDIKTKSTNFAKDNNYDETKMYTKLSSSYAWDAALSFIQKTNSTYATDSTYGNYSDSPQETGLTRPVCNIYDMGGNLKEYTLESSNIPNLSYIARGGAYYNISSDCPASYRGPYDGVADSAFTFRITLYLK